MILEGQIEGKSRSRAAAGRSETSCELEGIHRPACSDGPLAPAPEYLDCASLLAEFRPEPFSPVQRRVLDLSPFVLEAYLARLQSGITVMRLDLQPKDNAPIRVRLPAEISLFGSVQEGAFSVVLPDLGRQTFKAGDWFILRTRDLQFLSTEPLSLLLFAAGSDILQKILTLAAPGECQTLRCFTCPRLREPSIVHHASGGRLAWLSSQIELSGAGGLDHHLSLEARCLDWLRELFRQPQLSNRLCHSVCTRREEEILREVAGHFGDHLDAEHTLAGLSRRFNLNEFKLKCGFKSVFGVTVFQYLRKLRMQKAERLLKEGDCSVLEIANAVGYSNPSHFARNFKDQIGLLPKAYQLLHRPDRI